jgi:hypothetical protein
MHCCQACNPDIHIVVHASFVYTFTIYLHTKSHMPVSNGSLVIAVKLKAEDNFHVVRMTFFYTPPKKKHFNKG